MFSALVKRRQVAALQVFVYLRFTRYYLLASMEIALAVSFLLLLALTFLATVDMAFGQLSDVGLRRLAAEAEEHPEARYAPLLNEILENRSRFSFTLSAAIQILLVAFTVLVTFVSLALVFTRGRRSDCVTRRDAGPRGNLSPIHPAADLFA